MPKFLKCLDLDCSPYPIGMMLNTDRIVSVRLAQPMPSDDLKNPTLQAQGGKHYMLENGKSPGYLVEYTDLLQIDDAENYVWEKSTAWVSAEEWDRQFPDEPFI